MQPAAFLRGRGQRREDYPLPPPIWRAAPKVLLAVEEVSGEDDQQEVPLGARQNHSSGNNDISTCPHFIDKDIEALKHEEICLKSHGRSVVKQGVDAHSPTLLAGPPALGTPAVCPRCQPGLIIQ